MCGRVRSIIKNIPIYKNNIADFVTIAQICSMSRNFIDASTV
jgi:hypothetical protein